MDPIFWLFWPHLSWDSMISDNLPKNFHQNGRSVADDILKCTLKIQLFDMAIVSHYSVLHTLCIHYAFDDIYPYWNNYQNKTINPSTSSIETNVSGGHVYGCNFAANQYFSKSFQVFLTNSIPVEMTSWSLRYVTIPGTCEPFTPRPTWKRSFSLYYNVKCN